MEREIEDVMPRVRPIRNPGPDDRLFARRFLSPREADLKRFKDLFGYFADGFVRHAAPGFSRIHYPGMPSIRGHSITGLEGFARTAPLLAAWLHSGRGPKPGGRDLAAMLGEGILRGTRRGGPGYWGGVADDDQRMVEAADVARTLWLSRTYLWDRWGEADKAQVAGWLLQVNISRIRVRNNWLLFPEIVNAALNALGWPAPDGFENYREFKALHYRGHGWFFDIPEGIDFYNCWGISYDLYWLHCLAPHLDRPFLTEAIGRSYGTPAVATRHTDHGTQCVLPDGCARAGRGRGASVARRRMAGSGQAVDDRRLGLFCPQWPPYRWHDDHGLLGERSASYRCLYRTGQQPLGPAESGACPHVSGRRADLA